MFAGRTYSAEASIQSKCAANFTYFLGTDHYLLRLRGRFICVHRHLARMRASTELDGTYFQGILHDSRSNTIGRARAHRIYLGSDRRLDRHCFSSQKP